MVYVPDNNMKTILASMVPDWRWITFFGVLMVAAGLFGLFSPFMTGMALEMVVGWLLMIGGVIQIVDAFARRKHHGFWYGIVSGAAAAIAGFMLLRWPFAGAVTLSLIVAAFFIVTGVAKLSWAASLKRNGMKSGWVTFSGVIDILFGVYVYALWPASAVWVLGVLVAVQFLMMGFWMIGVGSSFRRELLARGATSSTSSSSNMNTPHNLPS